jgi:hypothetical protein
MRSARCSILIMEKCPESSASNFFCFSVPTHHQHHTLQNLGHSCSIPGSPTVESSVAPFTALLLVLFDIVGLVLIVHLAQYDSQIWNVDVAVERGCLKSSVLGLKNQGWRFLPHDETSHKTHSHTHITCRHLIVSSSTNVMDHRRE